MRVKGGWRTGPRARARDPKRCAACAPVARQRRVQDRLARAVLRGEVADGAKVTLDVKGDGLCIVK